jgi:hypothetical protein
MRIIAVLATCALVSALLVYPESAFAGPGGMIAKELLDRLWGKVLLGILVVVFLPLIILILLQTKIAERRAMKDLRFMAAYSSKFEWLKIFERAKDCFYRVHSGWRDEDLSNVSSWMTDWYWQNQQSEFLDRWKREGLVNICNVRWISNIKPILFVHRNQGREHEDSMVVVSITAKMQDYLQERSTGKIVEGSKKFKDVKTIWTFTLEDGEWKVSNIEESGMWSAYTKLRKELPRIESTVVSELRA